MRPFETEGEEDINWFKILLVVGSSLRFFKVRFVWSSKFKKIDRIVMEIHPDKDKQMLEKCKEILEKDYLTKVFFLNKLALPLLYAFKPK